MATNIFAYDATEPEMINEIKTVQETAELIYSAPEIEAAIAKMAIQINSLLAETNLHVLCVMNGGIIISGQLITRLSIPLTFEGINASRYQNMTVGSTIEWILKPVSSLKERTVLIIDDILDEGFTLQEIKKYCLEQGASAVYSAVLINKNLGRTKPVSADFIGLEVDNRYIFGYGMDYKGYLRNAPGIYACKEKETNQ